jgi:hypothetical protein
MNAYEKYYISQAGGALPVFAGARTQKGHGLGSLFQGLARAATPLLVSGAKAAGKQAIKSGLQVMGDVARGRNLKRSLKNRGMQGVQQLLDSGIKKLQSSKGVSLSQAVRRNTSRTKAGNKSGRKVARPSQRPSQRLSQRLSRRQVGNGVPKRRGTKRKVKAQHEDTPSKRPRDIFS